MDLKKRQIIFAHTIDLNVSGEGGGVRYITDFAKYMSERGADVMLLGIASQKSARTVDMAKIRFTPVNKIGSGALQLFTLGLLFKIPFLRLTKGAIIHTIRVDFMVPFLLYYPKSPKVITLGGRQLLVFSITHPFLYSLFGSVLASLIRMVLSRVDAVITDEVTLSYYRRIYGEIDKKAIVLPTSSVHMDIFRPLEKSVVRREYGLSIEEKVIVYIGRISREKNIEFLIRVFDLVKKKNPISRLLIVGSGSDVIYLLGLKKLVSSLGLDASVNFLGERRHEEIPSIINVGDVLALCSICEGSPTVIREALACGVPVVSSDVGDVSLLLDNDVIGSIVKFDEEKYATEIVRFFEMNSKDAKVKRRMILIHKRMDFDSVASSILKIYQRIIERSI
jgi:L-malate glycosyltransferase